MTSPPHNDVRGGLDAILPVPWPAEWAEVGGVSLPVRVVHTLARAGVGSIVIVCPAGAGSEVSERLQQARVDGPCLVVIEQSDASDDPAAAIASARDHVTAPALVVMPGYVFSTDIVRALCRSATDRTVLAVDTEIARCADIPGALKIRHDAGRATEVGMSLSAYDGLVVGVFVAGSDLFDELLGRGRGPRRLALPQALQSLSSRGVLFIRDCGSQRWGTATSVAARSHTERMLQLYGEDLEEPRSASAPPLVHWAQPAPGLFERAVRRQRSGRLRPLFDAD